MTDLESLAFSTASLLNTVARKSLAPFARDDLFIGERCPYIGSPPTFLLQPGLSDAQRREAMSIVEARYASIAYGNTLVGNEIKLYAAD